MSAKRTAATPASDPHRGPRRHQVSVWLDQATLDRVAALMPAMSTPWRAATRSDVLRALIAAGLEVVEDRHATKPKGGRAPEPDA